MITAEILKTCTLTCQEGSIVEVTEQQFFALGDAARELPDELEITCLKAPGEPENAEIVEKSVENVENSPKNAEIVEIPETENAPETPEAETAPETPEKKSGRRKKKG